MHCCRNTGRDATREGVQNVGLPPLPQKHPLENPLAACPPATYTVQTHLKTQHRFTHTNTVQTHARCCCCSPQYMADVLAAVAPVLQPHHLVVSIAAGLTLEAYEKALPPGTRVVRVMPNTPILVGQGASAYCLGSHATEEDEAVVHQLLSACGVSLKVRTAWLGLV